MVCPSASQNGWVIFWSIWPLPKFKLHRSSRAYMIPTCHELFRPGSVCAFSSMVGELESKMSSKTHPFDDICRYAWSGTVPTLCMDCTRCMSTPCIIPVRFGGCRVWMVVCRLSLNLNGGKVDALRHDLMCWSSFNTSLFSTSIHPSPKHASTRRGPRTCIRTPSEPHPTSRDA